MYNKTNNSYLVQGRECGDCEVCCRTVSINTPELKKTANTNCHNLRPQGGCSLYPSWPPVCQKFYCAWRTLEDLDDSWRPDQNQIMIEFARENFPGPFAERTGFRFTVLDRNKLSKNRKFARFIMEKIRNGIPCLLAFGIEKNTEPAAAFLNFALEKAVKSNKVNAVLRELTKALEACDNRPKLRFKIKNEQLVLAEEEI